MSPLPVKVLKHREKKTAQADSTRLRGRSALLVLTTLSELQYITVRLDNRVRVDGRIQTVAVGRPFESTLAGLRSNQADRRTTNQLSRPAPAPIKGRSMRKQNNTFYN